jgi:beta-1,4-N-acetylglucosaminyltransferase
MDRLERPDHMKLFFYATFGGHFNEAMMLVESVLPHYGDVKMITFDSPELADSIVPTLRLKKVSFSGNFAFKSALNGLVNLPRLFYQLIKERPDVVISTGSGEIAIPALILANTLGIRTIYIETWTRVKDPSMAGRVLYYFADHFLVQWEDLLPKFGKRAKYLGGLL